MLHRVFYLNKKCYTEFHRVNHRVSQSSKKEFKKSFLFKEKKCYTEFYFKEKNVTQSFTE